MRIAAPTITARPYAGDADIAMIVAFEAACERVDQTEDTVSEAEIRESYSEPGFDPTQNVMLWQDQDGTLVALAEAWQPRNMEAAAGHPAAFIWLKVLPELRGQGLEAELLAWGEQQVAQSSTRLGLPLSMEVVALEQDSARRALFEQHGFQLKRYFWRMLRVLDDTLEPPIWPDGITVRTGLLSNEAYTELRNAIWVDHYGYQPWTTDMVAHYRAVSHYDPEIDIVAYAADGQPVGFCWGHIDPEEQAMLGTAAGWIGILGVRREYRKSGVGRALLRAGMDTLRRKGCVEARLGVDGASPTNATGLYLSEGFVKLQSRVLYSRVIAVQLNGGV